MEVGIVGMPGVGKTTLFNALTGQQADRFAERTHLGLASVPDPNLAVIAAYITSRKIVPATITFVDIPGVPAGTEAADIRKLNSFLEQIRQVDAICHVVRCFDDGSGVVDPAGDIGTMETELVLADLVVAEGARDRATRSARGGEPEARARVDLLDRVVSMLEDGQPIRADTDWSDPQKVIIKNFGFISAKPVIYVANVAEDDGPEAASATPVREHAATTGSQIVALCGQLEAELAELEEPDRNEMLESLGLAEPAIGVLARATNSGLGLTTFYTAGDKEVRAWTVPTGATAPVAAGVIHSDMQRGFIRAECFRVDDLVEYKSEKGIREAGKMRVEGKHYELQEGDVMHVLFNV